LRDCDLFTSSTYVENHLSAPAQIPHIYFNALAIMRFSAVSVLALPLLAAAATKEVSPLERIIARTQVYFENILSKIPSPNQAHSDVEVDAAAAKAGSKPLHILTLDDWKETIQGSVKPASSTPEEWWVLVTGGNKTCFGHCTGVETAFNETAALFATDPTAPHLAYLNCDNQPVLCNSWSAGPPNLWVMHVSAPPAPVDVRVLHLNSSTTTAKTFTDIHSTKSWKEKDLYEGYFHPFDGPLAKYGLAVPLGYFFWVLAIVPSWVFMIAVSFISRNIM
jgi:hypothetical protein